MRRSQVVKRLFLLLLLSSSLLLLSMMMMTVTITRRAAGPAVAGRRRLRARAPRPRARRRLLGAVPGQGAQLPHARRVRPPGPGPLSRPEPALPRPGRAGPAARLAGRERAGEPVPVGLQPLLRRRPPGGPRAAAVPAAPPRPGSRGPPRAGPAAGGAAVT